jgi:hypothetical protein
VTGDFDKDGVDDLATWNRDTGAWTQRTVSRGVARTKVVYFGAQP